MTEIIKINPLKPEMSLLKKAKAILENGGVISYPTDTVYGLGANAFDEKALKKIFSLKERDLSKPLILVVSKNFNLEEIVTPIPQNAKKLIKVFWPGPLTLILEAKEKFPSILISKTGKIGIRVPDNPVALALLSLCKFPITSTSANPSGMAEATTVQQVINYFPDKLDLIIDSGKSRQILPSTIVDFIENEFKIIRKGVITEDMIVEALTN